MAINWNAQNTTTRQYNPKDFSSIVIPNPRYEGAVLGFGTHSSVQIMSDVWDTQRYANVWNGTAVQEVVIASYEFGSYVESAEIDATDDVKALALAYYTSVAADRLRGQNAAALDAAATRAKEVVHGRELEVVRGRKVKIGTVGRCFWVGDNQWGMSVGLELADGSRVFTALHNVIVAQPDEHYVEPDLLSESQIAIEAARAATDVLAEATKNGRF